MVGVCPYFLYTSGFRNSEVKFEPGVSFYSSNKSPTKMACYSGRGSRPLIKTVEWTQL